MTMITLIYPLLMFALLASPVLAAGKPAAVQKDVTAPAGRQENTGDDPLGRSTPRGTVMGFMKAMSHEDPARAVEYLDTRQPAKRAGELARILQKVLDENLSGDLAALSRKPEGDLGDGLRAEVERVGVVKTDTAPFEILLERVQRGDEPPLWLFSSATLKHLPEIHEQFETPLAERYLPSVLTQKRLLHVPLWRWIAFLAVILLIFLASWLATLALTPLLRTLIRRLAGVQSERSVERIKNPFRLFVMALTVYAYVPLSYSALGRVFWIHVGQTLTVVSLTWFCLRLIDILLERAKKTQGGVSSGRTAVTRLFGQLGKGFAILTGAAVILYYAGFNLTAVLTGLGVGGLAVAFAAQKTLENLFGGIMIVSDRPIRVGDFVGAGEHKGTVEDIGLRSTRLRTVDRTVVSVPNGQLSAMSLENFALRDKIRFEHTLNLRYETSADQLRYVLAHIRKLLDEHPEVESAGSRVRLTRLKNSCFEVEVFAYVLVTGWDTFLEIQEDLLLRMVDIVEASGTSFAFPSQTTYFASDSGVDSARGEKAAETVRRWIERGEAPYSRYINKSHKPGVTS